MKKTGLILVSVPVAMLILAGINVNAQTATPSVFVSGLKAPGKIITSPKGNLLVCEAGNEPNTGRISIVDMSGNRRTLIDGLPSGLSAPNNDPAGPAGLAMRGRTLFVAIAVGDAVLRGPLPGTEVPNPNPSSPFFSSVLSIRLSPQAEETTQGVTITRADQDTLLSRGFLRLADAAGNELLVEVVTNFRNFTSAFRPDFPANVRNSNPYGIVIKGTTLYVVDASQNEVLEVDVDTGVTRTAIRFTQMPNPLPFGPRFIDAVPDSIRLIGKSLLISFLTGAPFPAGAAEVRKIRLVNKASEPFISGLTSAIDVLPVTNESGQNHFFVLEYSTNMLAQPPGPGRLLLFDEGGGSPVVMLNNLVTPTSLARDELTGDLFVSEISGRIIRVHIP